jgi:iron complex outermembrane receptor protein
MRGPHSAQLLRALLVLFLMIPAGAAAQEGRIEGVVLVGDSPVDDADVVIPGLGRRVRADGAGRFSFDGIPAGTYVVEAQSVRWGRGVETVVLEDGATISVTIEVEAIFHLDEMVVSAGAGATRRSEAYQPASVVTSRDLVAMGEASLGETLSRQPGVSSTYFGPGASRPVIRGIGGDRVRILEGGIGVGDASSTSPDHAVGVEARSADRIEVIRGPATLLYGSSAVGGVVNVLDGSIARERPTQPFTGHVELLGGSVADERTGSGAFKLRTGPVVFTGSGLWRDASDYSIPGFSELDPEPGEELEAGILENSSLESRRGSLGATVVGDRGYLGIAVSTQRSDYGVPGHAHHEEEGEVHEGEAEEGVRIDLEQERIDLEGQLRFGSGPFRNLKGRFGFADYSHVELEGEEVGTSFFNDYFEGRIESEHSFSDWSQGAFGVQLQSRDFEAIGDEAFVPPTTTSAAALFAYEDFRVSEAFRVQAGARYERQKAESTNTGVDRTDGAVSASLGFNWDTSELVSFSASLSRSVKLPNAEELFSNGPHAATRSYEVGDPELDAETALGLDVTAHLHTDRLRGSASFFTTGFSDYIYQSATGEVRDELAEFRYVQGDARFTGFEVEGEIDVIEGDPSANAPHLSLEVTGDLVRARLTDTDENLPRIPPMRLGGGVNYRQGHFVVRAGARHSFAQDDVAPFETSTEGFTMVDASISYRLFTGGFFHDITLAMTNLTDEEARLHTSFLKDLAPLPGREIRLVYRLNIGG